MIRIKDNVDLELLKDYGFRLRKNFWYIQHPRDKDIILCHLNDDRSIDISGGLFADMKIDIMYDLFRSDLVEKVDDIIE